VTARRFTVWNTQPLFRSVLSGKDAADIFSVDGTLARPFSNGRYGYGPAVNYVKMAYSYDHD